jgi:hypothetical protein
MERALDQTDSCDIIKDYTSNQLKAINKKSRAFNVLNPYEDESLRGRPIMTLQWSPLLPELFLATYGSKVNIPTGSKFTSSSSSSLNGS